jgi:hypothetical protein
MYANSLSNKPENFLRIVLSCLYILLSNFGWKILLVSIIFEPTLGDFSWLKYTRKISQHFLIKV